LLADVNTQRAQQGMFPLARPVFEQLMNDFVSVAQSDCLELKSPKTASQISENIF
jgi:hypothetical protein